MMVDTEGIIPSVSQDVAMIAAHTPNEQAITNTTPKLIRP